MIPTGFITSPIFLDHDTGLSHPESPERLKSIAARLKKTEVMEHLMSIEPRPAQRQELELVHSRGYIESIKSRCDNGVTIWEPPQIFLSVPVGEMRSTGIYLTTLCLILSRRSNLIS